MRPLHVLPLVLVFVAAFALRWAGANELVLDAEAARDVPSGVLVDDATTCTHLRGVALAAPLARAPERDAFLDHPDGAERDALPLFDTLVAGLALRFFGAREEAASADGGLDLRSEARLERALLRIGPLLGLITALCAWAAARAACRGPAREWCALLAAAVAGLAPAAIETTRVARLDVGAWCALASALLAWIVARALRASGLREGLITALLAGASAGLLCASSLAGVLFFLAALGAFVARAWRAPAEERRARLREALFFGGVAAFAGTLPLAEQAEVGTGVGVLAQAWQGELYVMLLACVPVLAAFALNSGRSGRFFQSAVLAVAIVGILYCVPQIGHALGTAWSTYRAHAPLAASFEARDGGLVDERWLALSPLIVALPWAVWILVRHAEPGEREWLVGAACAGVALTLVDAQCAALACVALAVSLARALDLVSGARAPRGALRGVIAALAALPVLVAGAYAARATPRSGAELAARVELVRALRWMRAGTPEPVLAAGAAPHYGVLIAPQDAALALYHARRPVSAVPQAFTSDVEPLERTLAVLAQSSPEALTRHMRERGARYLVVSPAQVRTTLAIARDVAQRRGSVLVRADERDALVWRLACPPGGAAPIAGLRAVHSSSERARVDAASTDARDEGPAATVWELDDVAPSNALPSLSPR